jgi:hypothetical protein
LLSKSCLRTLYFSLIYPYLHYCILVWGSTYQSNLERIVLLQKRVIRIINKKEYDAHTSPLFKESVIFKLNDIYLFCLGKFMYLASKNYLPPSFKNFFLVNSEVHSYNTKSSNLIISINFVEQNYDNFLSTIKVQYFLTPWTRIYGTPCLSILSNRILKSI